MLSLLLFQQPPAGIPVPTSYLPPGAGPGVQVPPIPANPQGYLDNPPPADFIMVRGSDTAWVRGRVITFDIWFTDSYPLNGYPVSMRTLGFTYVDHVVLKDNSVGILGAPSGMSFEWDTVHQTIRVLECGGPGVPVEVTPGGNLSAVCCRATFYGGI